MSSYEINRPPDFDPADPIGAIDTAAVCASMMNDLERFDSVRDAVSIEQDIQMGFNRDLYDAILTVGDYLVPRNPDGTSSSDIMKKRVYLSGAILALKTVDSICNYLEIDTESFHAIWESSGYIKVLGIDKSDTEGKTPVEIHEMIGQAIEINGHAYLRMLDENYVNMIDAIVDEYDGVPEPNLLKGAYAHILGSAQHAFAGMFRELEARRLIDNADYDGGIEYLSEEPIKVHFLDDDVVSDVIDTEMFYSDEEFDVNTFFENEIDEQMTINEEVVEVLRVLSLTLYSTEDDYAGEMNDNAEAFFHGSIMALRYAKEHCEVLDIDPAVASSRWRKDRTHSKLFKLEYLTLDQENDVDTQVVKTLQHTELSVGIHQLADKVGMELAYEESDLAAFKNGLQYTLETYRKTIKSYIDTRISRRVKIASQALDADIEKLLKPTED